MGVIGAGGYKTMKEGDGIDIQYTANYNHKLGRWVALEQTTYPVLLMFTPVGITEVDISYGYDRNFSTHSKYIEYMLHISHDSCYNFFLFDKGVEKWTGFYK